MRQYQLETSPRIMIKVLEYGRQIIIEQGVGISENKIRIPREEAVIDEFIEILRQAKQ